MSKEAVAFVKVRNDELGDKRRERLCYIQGSAEYFHFENKYFCGVIKTLQTLERHIAEKDIHYEIETIDESQIAAESFNRKLRGEPVLTYYRSDNAFIMHRLDYLKEKTDDKYLLNLMDKFYDRLNHFSQGVKEWSILDDYVNEIVKKSERDNSGKVKSTKR